MHIIFPESNLEVENIIDHLEFELRKKDIGIEATLGL